MISNEERRAAAARLRQFLSEPWNERSWYHDSLQNVGSLVGTSVGENILARLADLIDRPTCKNNSEFGSHTVTVPDAANDECFDFVCSRCGIHLMGDEMDNSPLLDDRFRSYALRYCPNCGAEVVE